LPPECGLADDWYKARAVVGRQERELEELHAKNKQLREQLEEATRRYYEVAGKDL
jgi:hypothetical protein